MNDIELPSLSKTAARIIQLCAEPRCDLSQIVEAVGADAALTSKLMRLANAPFYGQGYAVATLRRAAVVLGLRQVKSVALAFQLGEVSRQWRDLPIEMERCWAGNLLRACVARQLAMSTTVADAKSPEEAFLVGLMQDFAVPLMAQGIGPAYRQIVCANGMSTDASTMRQESELTGSNHAHLAGAIFDRWRFPPLLTFAITNHHLLPQLSASSDKAVALWQVAYWVGAVPFEGDGLTAVVAAELRALARTAFALDGEALGETFYRAIEDFEAMASVFDGMLPNDVDASTLLTKAQSLLMDMDEESQSNPMGERDAR